MNTKNYFLYYFIGNKQVIFECSMKDVANARLITSIVIILDRTRTVLTFSEWR